MTLAPTPTQVNVHEMVERFTVVSSEDNPNIASQGIRSPYVEQEWLPYLRPTALLFARRCDEMFAKPDDGHQSVAVIVSRWADSLGVFPEEIIAARNRLIRFGFATWDGNKLTLRRYWEPVPEAIKTPEHRAALLAIPDIVLPQLNPYIEPVDDDADRG